MNKTPAQTRKFVAQCNFGKEWSKVKAKCDTMYPKGFIVKPQHPISSASYEDFEKWLESDFSVGDIVAYGNTIGVLKAVTPERVSLGAYYIRDNSKILVHDLLIDSSRMSHVLTGVAGKFHNDLLQAGFSVDPDTLNIVKAFHPAVNNFIEMHTPGHIYRGIVKEVDKEYVVFHVVKDETLEEKPVWSRNTKVTTNSETSYSQIIGKDLKEYGVELVGQGLQWHHGGLIKLPKRAKLGEQYWFITELFTVKSSFDMYTRLSNNRYDSGNYFLKMEEAIEYSKKIQQLLAERTKLS